MRTIRLVSLALLVVLATFSAQVYAQSLISGDITGVVSDPTGAVVPDTKVTLKGLETGSVQNTTTGSAGEYRFTLLKPGHYQVTATQAGFQTTQRAVEVSVGQVATVNIQLEVGQSTQTVEVTTEAPLVNPEASIQTSFTQAQLALLPSAGGDITNIAFTAPGAVVNTTGGMGNFNVNGLPATSNLFTVNGENDMDPYFNINNSGATNLTLGQNELQEATVVTNPYAGQYGQLSGAQVNYITKSGTNQFHGNAQYFWNGRLLNANEWFSNSYGDTRPFANANQWSDSLGGPILKNKMFFFVDNEGLRFVLPSVQTVTIPSPAFASAVISNVQAKDPAEVNLYQKMFNLWAGAPGAGTAQPIPNSTACNTLVLPGFNPATSPCALRFSTSPNALADEWILAFKIDYVIGSKDNAYYRYRGDHGLQPSSVSAISPAFNALSSQPSYDNQFNETHIFGPRSTNSFMATLSHYVAQFQQNQQQALSTFPYGVVTSGTVPFSGFNPAYDFPQGRNITQYQFIDDYTLTIGKHNMKFGENFRRYDVSDHNFFFNTPGVYFGYTSNGLQNFVNGRAYQYRGALNLASDVPIAMWGMGVYAQDEWSVTPHLRLTLALRAEHNSNPVCQINCFANFKSGFSSLASYTSSNPGSVPYSADIATGLHQAFPGVDKIDWSPRIGFSWSPGSSNKTVISGGFGIFYDNVAAGLVDNLLSNPPVSVAIRVRPSTGVLPFDPGPSGGPATLAASQAAFNINQTYSQLSATLKSLGSVFAAPAFTALVGTLHSPEFQEWNLQVQRELSNSVVLTVGWVANHGIKIPYSNAWGNAYDLYGLYPGVPGIPASAPVPNYGQVTQIQSGALSNYNGLNVTLTKRFSNWMAGHLNYTWSHAIDEVSNGGVFAYGGESLTGQINPLSLRANNYGNADYDIRHNFSADFLVNPTYKFGNHIMNAVLGGWQLSGKIFWRSGLPFSVGDNNTALGNGGGALLATPVSGGGPAQSGCGESSVSIPCLNANAFLNSGAATFNNYTAFSPQNRNMFRGPAYFNTDMALFKTIRLAERASFGFGAQAFNVFNHPNFALPDSGFGDSTFGLISGTVSTPTSPYGVFLGFNSSPRVLQLSGKLVF